MFVHVQVIDSLTEIFSDNYSENYSIRLALVGMVQSFV